MPNNAYADYARFTATDWEAAYNASERRFRLLVAGATNFAMFLIDKDGCIASWNEGARRVLGYTEEEVLGRSASLIFTPEDCAAGIPEKELATALRESRASDVRWHQRKDGSRFWADGVMERLTGDTGEFEGYAKLLRDATEAKHAADALRESAAALQVSENQLRDAQVRLDAALSAGNIGTWTWDLVNERLFADKNLARLFSLTPETTAGGNREDYLAAIHPEDRDRVRDIIADAVAHHNTYEAEYRVVLPDGSDRWLVARGTVERDPQGKAIALPGVVLDITERVQREQRDHLLVEVVQQTYGLAEPQDVIAKVVEMVGTFLHVDRCLFAEIDMKADLAIIHDEYRSRDTVPNIIGTLPFSAFGSFVVSECEAGRVVAVDDVRNDPVRVPSETLNAYLAIGVLAHVAVPAVYGDALVGVLAVHNDSPRHWQPEDIELLRTIVDRIWVTVENARLTRRLQEESEQLRQQGEYLQRILQSSPDCIKTLDLNGRMLTMTDGGKQVMEVDDFSVICGSDWLTFWEDDTPAAVFAALEAARQGRLGRFQGFCPTLKGTPRWWDVMVAPIFGADGKPEELLGLSRDITEQKRLEQERERTLGEQHQRAEREVLLNAVGAAVRATLDVKEIQKVTTELLGEGLNADRCYFVHFDDARGTSRVFPEWFREGAGLKPLAGQVFQNADYGTFRDPTYSTSRTHVLSDVDQYGDEEAASLRALQVHARIRVPIEISGEVQSLSVAMGHTARYWTEAEVRLVENVATLVRAAMESAQVQRRERNIAHQLQEALIPAPPSDLPGLSIRGHYKSALAEASVGGDFYDVFPLDQEKTVLVVGDLSGKGLKAASEVATVRNMVRYALYADPNVSQAITTLDQILIERDLLTGFATLFVGVYDNTNQTLTYVNCGQEPALLWKAATGTIEWLPPTGAVLGGFKAAADYEQSSISLASGDRFAIFTDGLTDVGPDRRSLLNAEGVSALFQECCQSVPVTINEASGITQALLDRLISAVDAYGKGGVKDDIALLVGCSDI